MPSAPAGHSIIAVIRGRVADTDSNFWLNSAVALAVACFQPIHSNARQVEDICQTVDARLATVLMVFTYPVFVSAGMDIGAASITFFSWPFLRRQTQSALDALAE